MTQVSEDIATIKADVRWLKSVKYYSKQQVTHLTSFHY